MKLGEVQLHGPGIHIVPQRGITSLLGDMLASSKAVSIVSHLSGTTWIFLLLLYRGRVHVVPQRGRLHADLGRFIQFDKNILSKRNDSWGFYP